MAKKSAASQMKEHEKTYQGFITLSKLSIIAIALTMVALYFLVIGAQVVLGWVVLLIVMPASVIYAAMSGSGSKTQH